MSQKDEESISKISRMLEIGGTMLAQHCTECGAPLFRYKGNVICPVCDTGQKPSAQAQEKFPEKKKALSSEFSANTEDKEQLPSSVNVVPSSGGLPAGVNKITPTGPEVPERSKSVPSSSLQELEDMLIKKTIMLAHSMQQEQDPRRIKEFLELIGQSLDLIDRLKK
ncbi:Sjogren's syndrome/scleroderma autoantigen 1 family protein [Methanomethylovorans sp.]|uniref:Sjogren's syndrome/scleroderma autoantigen 1 family protein n=1 Tax=Methanomethylovorans sp. TaxID=2758717 RepID=UPI002FDECD9F